MKLLRFILLTFPLLTAIPSSADEIVLEGLYDGRNESALIYKKCGLQVFRTDDGMLNVAAVHDSANVYNMWVRDGGDFKLDQRSGVKVLGRQMRFDVRDASRTSIHHSRTDKNDLRPYPDYGTLEVLTDTEGRPLLFKFVYAKSTNGAAPYKPVNTIQCRDLQAR